MLPTWLPITSTLPTKIQLKICDFGLYLMRLCHLAQNFENFSELFSISDEKFDKSLNVYHVLQRHVAKICLDNGKFSSNFRAGANGPASQVLA